MKLSAALACIVLLTLSACGERRSQDDNALNEAAADANDANEVAAFENQANADDARERAEPTISKQKAQALCSRALVRITGRKANLILQESFDDGARMFVDGFIGSTTNCFIEKNGKVDTVRVNGQMSHGQ